MVTKWWRKSAWTLSASALCVSATRENYLTNCCGLIIMVNLFMEEHLRFQASIPTLLPKTLTNKEEAGGGDKKRLECFLCSKKKKNDKKKTQKVEEKIKRSPGGNCNKLNREWGSKSFSHRTIKHEKVCVRRMEKSSVVPLYCEGESDRAPDVSQTCLEFHCDT